MNRLLAIALYTLNQRGLQKKVKQENERYVRGPIENLFKCAIMQRKQKAAIITHDFKHQQPYSA